MNEDERTSPDRVAAENARLRRLLALPESGPLAERDLAAAETSFREREGRFREVEQALRDESRFSALVIARAAEGLCVCHLAPEFPHVRFTVWNERMTEITGYTMEEINRAGWYQSLYPDPATAERAQERMKRMRAGEDLRGEQWEITRRDGAHRVLRISSTLIGGDGAPEHVLGLMEDVTERVRAENDLRESRQFIDRIAAAAPLVMYVFDLRERRVVWASRRVAKDLGYSAEEVQSMGDAFFVRLVHPEDLSRMDGLFARWDTAPDGVVLEAEYRLRHADGSWRWCSGHDMVFARDADGKARQLVGVVLDVTARKQMEERLIVAQRVEGLGRLAGGVAHDFNNLLTTILGIAEALRADRPAGDSVGDELALVVEAAEHGAALTRQLLAFARKQTVQMVVVDLNDVVSQIETMLRRTLGTDVDVFVVRSPAPLPVRIDPAQFQQVLLNLAVNARDAMPAGGTLTFALSLVAAAPGPVAGSAAGAGERPGPGPGVGVGVGPGDVASPRVLLEVTDTGVGMTPAVQQRIFEPFFTTKPVGRGTGLGLATCYGIVTQSGGTIAAQSEAGRGTTFRIHLPRADSAPAPAVSSDYLPGAAGAEFEARSTGTVLVVEDAVVIRAIAVRTLTAAGFHVLSAEDGDAALGVSRAFAGTIDVLVTDVVMPHMGGHDLARRMRIERPATRILMTSGYPGDSAAPDVPFEFLEKPYTPSVLLRRVSALVARR